MKDNRNEWNGAIGGAIMVVLVVLCAGFVLWVTFGTEQGVSW